MDHLKIIQSKIFEKFDEFSPLLESWNQAKETVVFTNGCFDIVHRGHIEYLARAASMGSKLVIGLNSDASVKRLKGESRPVNNQHSRAILLAALSFADAVIFFDEDTPYNLIEKILPDVLVKGDDYSIEEIAGYDVVLAHGGKVETIGLVEGFSTSALIGKLRK